MSENSSTSPTLLDGLLQGSSQAWRRFTYLYAPLVYQWGRKAGLQPEDVADVTQEVFRVVHAKLDRFESGRKETGAFRSWLFGIARIAILDYRRSQAKEAVAVGGTDVQLAIQQQVAPEPIVDEPGETILGVDRVVLRQAINLIRDEYNDSTWQAFWQTAVAGKISSEVGRDLGLSPAAVRQAKYRVLRRLRAELNGFARVEAVGKQGSS